MEVEGFWRHPKGVMALKNFWIALCVSRHRRQIVLGMTLCWNVPFYLWDVSKKNNVRCCPIELLTSYGKCGLGPGFEAALRHTSPVHLLILSSQTLVCQPPPSVITLERNSADISWAGKNVRKSEKVYKNPKHSGRLSSNLSLQHCSNKLHKRAGGIFSHVWPILFR